jgi:phage-related minor tail protein
MRLLIASYEKLSPLERVLGEIRVEEIRIQEEINKTTKDTANARKEMEGITKGLMTAEEKYIADIERYMLLIAKVPDLEAAGVEAIKRRTEAYNDERDKMFKTAKDTDKMYDKLADKIDGYAKDISSTFIDFISNANDAKFSFSDFATSVLRDVAKMVTQFLIIEPLMSNLKKTLKDIDTGDQGGGGILAKIFRQMTGTPSYEGDFAYGAAFAHASPSLSRYSNGVYNRPRTFEFAKGAGVFAEAGPEAIMPLTRTASGELGVASTGGGDVVVNVINQAGADVAVKSSKSANGEREINIMVQQAVADGFSRGRFDGVMGATYGLSRRGR